LSSGTAAYGRLADLLQQIQTSFPSLVNESGPLLADVTQNPNGLSLTLQGLGEFAGAVSAAESHGPFLAVNTPLVVPNISAGVNAALGYDNPASISQALGAAVNPPPYTAANCPEYPGESNPYCGVGGSPDATPVRAASTGAYAPSASPSSGAAASPPTMTSAGSSSPAPAAPLAQEQRAVQDIATAVNGGRPPASSAVASILLLALLSSMSSGR